MEQADGVRYAGGRSIAGPASLAMSDRPGPSRIRNTTKAMLRRACRPEHNPPRNTSWSLKRACVRASDAHPDGRETARASQSHSPFEGATRRPDWEGGTQSVPKVRATSKPNSTLCGSSTTDGDDDDGHAHWEHYSPGECETARASDTSKLAPRPDAEHMYGWGGPEWVAWVVCSSSSRASKQASAAPIEHARSGAPASSRGAVS